MKQKKQIKPKHFTFYYLPVLLMALTGLADSIYLSISHYRVYTDISYKSFCAISKAMNCDTVSQSDYAIFLGLPVPLLGVLGYLLFFIITAFSYRDVNGSCSEVNRKIGLDYCSIDNGADKDVKGKKRGWHLLFIISAAFSAYSVFLAVISNYYIHSYCIMCILSYAVNFALLFLTWMIIQRFYKESFFKSLKADLFFIVTDRWLKRINALFIIVVSALFIFFPDYWIKDTSLLTRNLPSGLTEDGHPWIGAENPEITIVEYADYRCFQCGKMHYYLRDLIESNPDKIRLVHKHFPMDHQVNPLVQEPFHVGAGKMALLAIYASSKGKFWEMNDLLYNIKGDFNVRTLAKETGISAAELVWAVKSKEVKALLNRDMTDGFKLGVSGTPSFEINGELHFGTIPPEILNRFLKKQGRAADPE